jgi:hypothetical protein
MYLYYLAKAKALAIFSYFFKRFVHKIKKLDESNKFFVSIK